MKAVLFVGHGSRDQEGNEEVIQVVNRLKERMDKRLIIETCFLEFVAPDVQQGIGTCVEKGAKEIAVIPIMLLPAGHSKIHIPMVIDEANKKYPSVSITYGKPIGVHPLTLEICQERLKEIGEDVQKEHLDTAIILLGRGGSDPDANSDLYKLSRMLWEKLNYPIVETAFMGVTSPLIQEGVERAIKLGAKKIIIVPYFLFTGILIKRLHDYAENFKQTYADTEFSLTHYFGFHPLLEDILLERAEEALQGPVSMNCDTCQYRRELTEHLEAHHHHHHH
ncbi:sirohydrochlorin chelatase [Bacillus sp. FJAT-47783]|uniref:sirohydrochlorin chelatase n=1 Tax=Bacillus sp. FJAT-47783 TaxID=2922712 RepID=UPI001FAD2EC8|nr:sirohydrochlorin chelatase [Bacillus sp. FJAT-47783]